MFPWEAGPRDANNYQLSQWISSSEWLDDFPAVNDMAILDGFMLHQEMVLTKCHEIHPGTYGLNLSMPIPILSVA